MVTDISQLDFNGRYTYADYLTWDFDEMVELIRGQVFKKSPAPSTSHQWAASDLHTTIGQYLSNKPCKVFSAPFDVRLPLPEQRRNDGQIDTVVQPDLCVVCDLSKLDQRGCNGTPDWIIEILSPDTAPKDLHEKFDLYQHAGVREYWIVHPSEGTVLPYRLDGQGAYQLLRQTPYTKGERVPVGVFPDFSILLDDNVFME